jgi:hypothetical protein
MDPLSASLAGTILEFTRFGISLLKTPRTIHGTLSANDQLELAAADLGALLVKLKARQPDIASAPGDHVEGKDDTFQNILNDAQKAAAELIERLH